MSGYFKDESLENMQILKLLRTVVTLEFTVDARRRPKREHINLWWLHCTTNEHLRSVPAIHQYRVMNGSKWETKFDVTGIV
jgi:hypothetical protein